MEQIISLSQKFVSNIPLNSLFVTFGYLTGILLLMGWYGLEIIQESLISFVRTFFQLITLAGILLFFFELNSVILNIVLCFLMTIIAGITAATQSPQRGALAISFFSQGVAVFVTILPMTYFEIISLEASFFIPIVAMVIRNTLDRASLAFERLDREMKQNKELIEQYLALGLDSGRASRDVARQSIESSMIPTLNKLNVVGLVGLPGLMTGIIISAESGELIDRIVYGATLQAIVLYMIFGASIMSSIILTHWMKKSYFNEHEQIVFTSNQST